MQRLPNVRAIAVSSLEELPGCLAHTRQYFSLLLAWNAPDHLSTPHSEALKKLVDDGLIYFCAWGENCERVHDAVDDLDIHRLTKVDHIVVTTWHESDTLDEAMFFFSDCVRPAEPIQNVLYDRFAVSIGRPDWHHDIDRYFNRKEPIRAS